MKDESSDDQEVESRFERNRRGWSASSATKLDYKKLACETLESVSNPDENEGLVFYADDQYFCSQSFGIHFSVFSPKNLKVESFYNGKDVVQRTKELLDKIEPKIVSNGPQKLQPIRLVLFSIPLPLLSGHATIQQMKELYAQK